MTAFLKSSRLKKLDLKKQRGFTLLELLIVFVVLGFMMLAIGGILSQSYYQKKYLTSRDRILQNISLLFERMNTDLESAFLLIGPEYLGMEGLRETAFLGGEDRLDFPSFAVRDYFGQASGLPFGEVGYFVEKEGDESVLKRRETNVIDNDPESGGNAEPMIDGVQKFTLEYYDVRRKEWLATWESSGLDFSGRLPRAVRVQIEVYNREAGSPISVSTVFELPQQLARGGF